MADETTDVNPLQEKLDLAISESKKYRTRAQTAETANTELTTQVTAFEAAKKAALDDAEKVQFEKKGEYDAALQKAQETHAAAIAEWQKGNDNLTGQLRDVMGSNQLMKDFAAEGIATERIADAVKLAEDRYKVDFVDGKAVISVFNEDGTPMQGEDGAATTADLAKSIAMDKPYLKPPTGDTGSGAHPGGSPGANAGLTQDYLAKHPAKMEEFINQYGSREESTAAFAALPKRKKER